MYLLLPEFLSFVWGGRGAVISRSGFSIVFGLLPTGVLGCATEDNPRTLVSFGVPARVF